MHVDGLPHHQVDIAFGAYVWGESLLQNVLTLVRNTGFRGRIILGGPQVSYTKQGLDELYPLADGFIRGYGEEALLDIVRTPGKPIIQGVFWSGEFDLQQQAQLDFASLPSPWLTGALPINGLRFVRWETQRGCPYACSFCQHREAGARLKNAHIDVPRLEQEVDLFCANDVREIAVLDPIFNTSRNAVPILERFAQNGYQGQLSLQCRAEYTKPNFLDVAAEMDVCLEFGLQTTHLDEAKAVNRRNKIDKIEAALQMTRERSIQHEVSMIFGLPLQTLLSFEESIDWCLKQKVPVIKAFPLMLLRGTELEQERERWGFVDSGGEMPTVISSNSFTQYEWQKMAQISEALKHTEGNHPPDIAELKLLANEFQPELERWSP